MPFLTCQTLLQYYATSPPPPPKTATTEHVPSQHQSHLPTPPPQPRSEAGGYYPPPLPPPPPGSPPGMYWPYQGPQPACTSEREICLPTNYSKFQLPNKGNVTIVSIGEKTCLICVGEDMQVNESYQEFYLGGCSVHAPAQLPKCVNL